MQAGVLQQILSDNFAGDNLMADMLGGNYQQHRNHSDHRIQVEFCNLEIRHRENSCFINRLKVDQADAASRYVTAYNGD